MVMSVRLTSTLEEVCPIVYLRLFHDLEVTITNVELVRPMNQEAIV